MVERLTIAGVALVLAGWLGVTLAASVVWSPSVVWPLSCGILAVALGAAALTIARLLARAERGEAP